MRIEAMTMPAFEGAVREARGCILPVGSVEEHGPHLPLGTDTIHAYELALRAAEGHAILVAPPIWYGLCRSTSQHPGTVSIPGRTLKHLVQDVITSLYGNGLRNFLILSGHAGGTHMAALVDACEGLVERLPQARFGVASVIDLVAIPGPNISTPDDSHAGEMETSLMQHLRPQWVQGEAQREFPSFPPHLIVKDKRRYWPGGVWGDPTKASPEKGEAILREEVERIHQIFHEMERLAD